MRKMLFGDDAREVLLHGAKKAYDVIEVAYSPIGLNGAIENEYESSTFTQDGVTLAESIEPEENDPAGTRVGIELGIEPSKNTNLRVGEGTSSSPIISWPIMREGDKAIRNGVNPQTLREQLEIGRDKVLEKLKTLSEPLVSREKKIQVATLSSKRAYLGEIIGGLYDDLGEGAYVTCTLGESTEIESSIDAGYVFEGGLISNTMVNDDEKQTFNLKDANIIVYTASIGMNDVIDLITALYQQGKDNLVVIADNFDTDFLSYSSKMRTHIDIVGIKAPAFGAYRTALLNDIAAFCGTKAVSSVQDVSIETLGHCQGIVSSFDKTILSGGVDTTDYIKTIPEEISEMNKDRRRARIASLKAKVGTIRVGAESESKAGELLDLVEDAVAATRAAITGGIVPGGGTTYMEIAKALDLTIPGEKILHDALQNPFQILMQKSGVRAVDILPKLKFGMGYDVIKKEIVDLKESGIIEPTLVAAEVVNNAVASAGTLLTTGFLNAIVKEKKNA